MAVTKAQMTELKEQVKAELPKAMQATGCDVHPDKIDECCDDCCDALVGMAPVGDMGDFLKNALVLLKKWLPIILALLQDQADPKKPEPGL